MNTPPESNRPSAAPQAPRRAVCAFSLVELAVVVALIGIIAGMAYPRYQSSLSRYRVDLSARRLATDLALAQTAARSTGAFQGVTIDPGNDRYGLSDQPSLSSAGGRYSVSLGDSPFFTTLRSARNENGDDVTLLRFDGYGRPDQSLSAHLRCGDHIRIVTVDGASGAINVTTP
ncbi:MAG TPA: prepilin-type N-terminal cleavage/methylation domain-containing protein [Phycisphaerales bacterium]|nr:prepilin-type N-terminal cleavage/methylation domain-containing protein [Phycisphaerales bacterium]